MLSEEDHSGPSSGPIDRQKRVGASTHSTWLRGGDIQPRSHPCGVPKLELGNQRLPRLSRKRLTGRSMNCSQWLPGQLFQHLHGFIDHPFAGAGFGVAVVTGPNLVAAQLVGFTIG